MLPVTAPMLAPAMAVHLRGRQATGNRTTNPKRTRWEPTGQPILEYHAPEGEHYKLTGCESHGNIITITMEAANTNTGTDAARRLRLTRLKARQGRKWLGRFYDNKRDRAQATPGRTVRLSADFALKDPATPIELVMDGTMGRTGITATIKPCQPTQAATDRKNEQ